MPRWTVEELRAYETKRGAVRKSDATDSGGLLAANPEPAQRETLERALPREATRLPRFEIVFHVYACQPADWDGYHVKELQDLVVRSGLIPDDDWKTLRGRVVPHKANSRKEQYTRIEIEELP